jgi:mRNA interferase RelE/StbE
MTWKVDFSSRALQFLRENNLTEESVLEKIRLAVRKFRAEDVNIDIKKLKGNWQGFYRIRSGRIRIIVEFEFEFQRAYIEAIDWRGRVYK